LNVISPSLCTSDRTNSLDLNLVDTGLGNRGKSSISAGFKTFRSCESTYDELDEHILNLYT